MRRTRAFFVFATVSAFAPRALVPPARRSSRRSSRASVGSTDGRHRALCDDGIEVTAEDAVRADPVIDRAFLGLLAPAPGARPPPPPRPIMRAYKPSASWLWRRWRGTVLHTCFPWIVANVGVGLVTVVWMRAGMRAPWPLGVVPPAGHPVIARLRGLETAWEMQLTLTTCARAVSALFRSRYPPPPILSARGCPLRPIVRFVLTFFLSQAYTFWRESYRLSRSLQGRLSDLSMLIAAHAAREDAAAPGDAGAGAGAGAAPPRYTRAAEVLASETARHLSPRTASSGRGSRGRRAATRGEDLARACSRASRACAGSRSAAGSRRASARASPRRACARPSAR